MDQFDRSHLFLGKPGRRPEVVGLDTFRVFAFAFRMLAGLIHHTGQVDPIAPILLIHFNGARQQSINF
jgi:hypothetical protein